MARASVGKLIAIKDILETEPTNFDEAYISFIETFGKEGKKLMSALLYLRADIKEAKSLRARYEGEVGKSHQEIASK